MSLLIKALEQAAKDREAASKAETSPDTATGRGVASTADAGGQRKAAGSLSDLARIEAQQRARAASVVQAGEQRGANVIGFLRANPVAMIGAVAIVVGIVFGAYVYIQVANPGLLACSPPPPPPAPPSTSPPQPAAPSGPLADLQPPAAPSPSSSASPAPPASSAPPSAPAPPVQAPVAAAPPAPVAAPPEKPAASFPIPSAAVVASSSTNPPAIPPPNPPARGTLAQREPPAEAPRETRAAAPAAAAAVSAPPRERIVVSTGSAKPTLNPSLGGAYAALQSGDMEQARTLYTRVIDSEPLNIDGLLGLASISVQENRAEDASKYYLRVLQLDPRNAVAQAAMISLVGRADPTAAETRLKLLISREPSAFLHFILGNVYADQSAWPQAQQSYFQAHYLEPDNPDYAYNLAVSLDHLRQSKLALNYYRRADQLAGARGRTNFNVSQARERIRSLSSQIE